jgi:uncharacterized protein (TIGR01777 family)
MRIIIAGGTGLIGKKLTKLLLAEGHQVSILTRNPSTVEHVIDAHYVSWDARTISAWGELISQVDAVINLAGENLGSGFWTAKKKQRIMTSRTEAGKVISDAIQKANPRPKVIIQASAVGFYGPRSDEPVTEDSPAGNDFLAKVCKEWERATQPVEEINVRRVVIRTGVVLSKEEGALKRMIIPFRFFAGGPLGSGKQGVSWIHPADEVASILYLMENEKARGVYNLSAPEPLSNAAFGRILARVMQRPFWLPVPSIALRLLLGQMSSLVLDGQFMLPTRLKELGYQFKFENAELALQDLLMM